MLELKQIASVSARYAPGRCVGAVERVLDPDADGMEISAPWQYYGVVDVYDIEGQVAQSYAIYPDSMMTHTVNTYALSGHTMRSERTLLRAGVAVHSDVTRHGYDALGRETGVFSRLDGGEEVAVCLSEYDSL